MTIFLSIVGQTKNVILKGCQSSKSSQLSLTASPLLPEHCPRTLQPEEGTEDLSHWARCSSNLDEKKSYLQPVAS